MFASRGLTILASAFLAFDGAALVALGWWSGGAALTIGGLACFFAAGLVVLLWSRHRRRLDEIAAARRELREEAQTLRDLLRE